MKQIDEETYSLIYKRALDEIVRVFYPTELGHSVIASFALIAMLEARIEGSNGVVASSYTKGEPSIKKTIEK